MNHYIFIVDYSYSMKNNLYKVINVINTFINQLKTSNVKSLFSLYYFSCQLYHVIENIDINILKELFNLSQFKNSGATALYDAVCTVILKNGFDSNIKKYLYIITDGDDNNSSSYTREDADRICNTALLSNNWSIQHFDTLNYSTLSVPTVHFDMDDISTLMNNLKM